jgi:glutaredoxin
MVRKQEHDDERYDKIKDERAYLIEQVKALPYVVIPVIHVYCCTRERLMKEQVRW